MAVTTPQQRGEFLSVREVSALLSITSRTVWKMVSCGRFPKPVYLTPRLPRWKRAEIDAHIEALAEVVS